MKRLQIADDAAISATRQIRVHRDELRADEREVARYTASRATALHS